MEEARRLGKCARANGPEREGEDAGRMLVNVRRPKLVDQMG